MFFPTSCSALEPLEDPGQPGGTRRRPTSTELALSSVTSQIVNNATYKLDFKQRRHKSNNGGSESAAAAAGTGSLTGLASGSASSPGQAAGPSTGGSRSGSGKRRKSSCTSCGGGGISAPAPRLTPEEAWQLQPQNSVTSAGSTNSSYSSGGGRDEESSYSAIGGDSSSSNSCNCDITGDNSTLHGFGVGDVSSFIGDCDECVHDHEDDQEDESQTLRTAAIVAAVAAAAKEARERDQDQSLGGGGNTDCESFSDRRQDADEGVRIIQDSGGNNDSLEDVGEVDDNADVVVRKNTRNRPSIRRTCRITEEDDDDDGDIDREEQEVDDEEPEGTTIDIDEQEQQDQLQHEDESVEDDDDEDVDEYFEEEEDDTQAFSPFYSSSAELIDNFGGGTGKFFNIMDFERGATGGYSPNGNGGGPNGGGDASQGARYAGEGELGGGNNIMGESGIQENSPDLEIYILIYHISYFCIYSIYRGLIPFSFCAPASRHRFYGHSKHSGDHEWHHHWTQWSRWAEGSSSSCCRWPKETPKAGQAAAGSPAESPILSERQESPASPMHPHRGVEVSF